MMKYSLGFDSKQGGAKIKPHHRRQNYRRNAKDVKNHPNIKDIKCNDIYIFIRPTQSNLNIEH